MKSTIQVNVTLITPLGKSIAPMQIVYDDENTADVICDVTYHGNTYQGRARENYWASAFADLQSRFPQDVKLACCMSCRHGNMCPYGNDEQELFCTKDLIIRSKNDMCDLFDNTDPFLNRMVRPYDWCDNFEHQSDANYTYNDYLYLLNRKSKSL